MTDGTRVADMRMWESKRRGEILELFREHMFGRTPKGPWNVRAKPFDKDENALGGKAIRKQVTVRMTGKPDDPALDLLMYLPRRATGPVPTFLLLNFQGNHAICTDPGIKLSKQWIRNGYAGVVDNRATEESRGGASRRFPIEAILERGYGLATAYYGDIDPDFDDGFANGIHGALDPKRDGERPGDAWASIGAWAWGLSRAMDYLQTDPDVDPKRVIVMGHSRLGKTALWAGAQDQRFAIVISNNSGCGGAAISRRRFGETVKKINLGFPHWFCGNFKTYDDREDALPIDQHMLIAMMAPRPVYVASAVKDQWADPRGEFLSCKHATSVYKLYDKEGMPASEMPDVDQPIMGTIGYHYRNGGHDVMPYDWQRYMDFADKHFGRKGSK
jgi:hypothetical protein